MTEVESDYIAEMRARRAKRIRIATRIGAAALALAFVVWGPGWMIGRADKSYAACSNDDYEDQPNPRTDCTGAKLWLLVPKIVPWKRTEAVAKSKSIDADAAERRLKLAVSFDADPAERDAAIKAVLAVADADRASSILGSKGVGWAMRERKTELVTSFAQASLLRQLVAHGDIDDAIAFAKNAPALSNEDYAARDLFLKRGALACLSGDPELGRKLIHDALRVHAMHHDFVFTQARIALAACGEITQPRKDDLDVSQLRSFMLGDSLKGAELDDRLIGRDYDWHIHGHLSPFVAAALAEHERPLEDTLKLVSAYASPDENLTLWAWENGMSTEPALVDPAVHEKAAERLETVAAHAPETQPAVLDDYSVSVAIGDRYRRLRQQPRAAFRRAACGLWIEAAGAWSHERQCDRSEAALRRAHALGENGDERIRMTSVLVACDRWELAAEIAKDESSTTKLGAAVLLVIRAQAMAHAGKYAEARDLAKSAYERAGPIAASDTPIGFGDDVFVRSAASYLFLAMSLVTKDMNGAPAIETPTIYEREKMSWEVLVAKPEAERAALRWRMFDFDGPLFSAARPAELFVVGSVAPEKGVEVWLDRAAFTWAAGKEGRYHMRARAEAARWRGDTTAETEWLNRAAKIEKLLGDPKKAILARIAGL